MQRLDPPMPCTYKVAHADTVHSLLTEPFVVEVKVRSVTHDPCAKLRHGRGEAGFWFHAGQVGSTQAKLTQPVATHMVSSPAEAWRSREAPRPRP